MKSQALVLAIAVSAASLAHLAQRRIDPLRRQAQDRSDRDAVASGELVRVAASGSELLVADVMWVRAVLAFGEGFQEQGLSAPGWSTWFAGTLDAVTTLDPTWATPYIWGGMMLEVAEDPRAAAGIYRRGAANLPDDYRFWFNLGMLEYFQFDDPQAAAGYMKRASECPGAPGWFANAAVAYGSERETRQAALTYLRQELESTADPDLRSDIQARIAKLEHEILAADINQVREQVEAQLGRSLSSPQELVDRTGTPLPPDPLEGEWILDVDGEIRSSVHAELLRDAALKGARGILTSPRVQAR